MKNTPQVVAQRLIHILPEFEKEWDEGESYGYQSGDYSLHVIFMTFAPVAQQILLTATEDQIRKFCLLINELVENGGSEENAISTGLLEHASQVGIRKIIKPYLSQKAIEETK